MAAAECAHFGRAAGSLHLTQQALSKRIARLEVVTGTLFERHAGGVRLTTRGERLLPVARRLLAVGDEALAIGSAGLQAAPLRIDVWSHLQTPHAAVLAWARRHPEIPVELSMRRSLPLALAALRRGELDLAFGDVASLDHPLPDDLRAEVAVQTPLVALVNRDGPLGAATVVTHDDLRRHGLWWPAGASSPELNRFAVRLAEEIGAPLATDGANLGIDTFVDSIANTPSLITLVGADWPIDLGDRTRTVALSPTHAYRW